MIGPLSMLVRWRPKGRPDPDVVPLNEGRIGPFRVDGLGFDEERLHIDPAEPFTDRLDGELRSVVGADVIGWATVREQRRE